MKNLVVLLLLAVIPMTGLNAQLTKTDARKYKSAYEYATSTNNKKAIDLLQDLYKKHPNDINITYNLGLCYMNMSGNPDSALYFLQKTRDLDTDPWSDERSELFMAIARTQQLQYKYDDALKTYDEIEKNDKTGAWAQQIKREREICNNAKILINTPVKLVVRNIENINSPYNDYRPVISFDQKTLIFTSRRKESETTVEFADGQYEENAYISTADENGTWSKPQRMKDLFAESGGQETATCVTNGGNTMYLCRDGNIYQSERDTVNNIWLKAVKLPEPINGAQSEERFACVTEDGNEMYFASNRAGGFGGFDIYHSYKLPNGKWGQPKNMGANINTPFDEDSPVKHPTKDILYFSSNGHNTMGGYDIFYAIQNSDSTFEAPRNIGYPINTPDDDIYFVPSAQKDMAYYASIKWAESDANNGFDIYEVEYEEPEIDKLAIIVGTINAEDISAVRITAEKDGNTIGRFLPNRDSGRFTIIVEAGGEYTIKAFDYDDRTAVRTVATNKSDSYSKLKRTINIGTLALSLPADKTGTTSSATTQTVPIETQSPTNDGIDFSKRQYTVQIMSLRDKCDLSEISKALDSSEILEFNYKDGWHVYSFGIYDSLSEANKQKNRILEITPYDDSFVRNIQQYEKFIKK